MDKNTIAIANDHAGYKTKQAVIKYLEENNIPYKDFGCYSEESCDYPDFAHPMAKSIHNGVYKRGISICGSGEGINMTVNKYANVRSALCWIPEIAEMARKHNDANICALPGRYVTDDEAVEIVKVFLHTDFEGGRHQRRIDKIPIQ
ncbi:MAG: ribose-5-phosphate isomerase [Draconibacterium sp.]|nr:MAG: ribose-5-phosphate isomerase [Draconibacterium sp.]